MDARTILQLPHTFTVDQLRYSYRALCKSLHPDKCGGRISREQATAAFQVLTEAYRTLLEEALAREQEGQYMDLKARFNQSREAAPSAPPAAAMPSPRQPGGGGARSFDVARFNNVFDENRMSDPVQEQGYKDWMEHTDPKVAAKDVAQSRQLVKYREPTPVVISRGRGNMQYTELGVTQVDDFSRDDAAKHGIQYTDYRVAHSTSKLADDAWSKDRRSYLSVDDLKAHRSTVSYEMTDAEAQEYDAARRKARTEEQRRAEACRQWDERVTDHYHRVHRALLGTRGTAGP